MAAAPSATREKVRAAREEASKRGGRGTKAQGGCNESGCPGREGARKRPTKTKEPAKSPTGGKAKSAPPIRGPREEGGREAQEGGKHAGGERRYARPQAQAKKTRARAEGRRPQEDPYGGPPEVPRPGDERSPGARGLGGYHDDEGGTPAGIGELQAANPEARSPEAEESAAN